MAVSSIKGVARGLCTSSRSIGLENRILYDTNLSIDQIPARLTTESPPRIADGDVVELVGAGTNRHGGRGADKGVSSAASSPARTEPFLAVGFINHTTDSADSLDPDNTEGARFFGVLLAVFFIANLLVGPVLRLDLVLGAGIAACAWALYVEMRKINLQTEVRAYIKRTAPDVEILSLDGDEGPSGPPEAEPGVSTEEYEDGGLPVRFMRSIRMMVAPVLSLARSLVLITALTVAYYATLAGPEHRVAIERVQAWIDERFGLPHMDLPVMPDDTIPRDPDPEKAGLGGGTMGGEVLP